MRELEIKTLGKFQIVQNGRQISPYISESTRALILFLAYQRQPYSLDYLGNFIWGEKDTKRAIKRFQDAYEEISHDQLQVFYFSAHLVEINPEIKLKIDVQEMLDTILEVEMSIKESGRISRHHASSIHKAMALYAGDFMQTVEYRSNTPYVEWVRNEAQAIKEILIQKMLFLADYYLETKAAMDGRDPKFMAMEMINRAEALIPYDPGVYLRKMKVLLSLKKYDEAKAVYQECSDRLAQAGKAIPAEIEAMMERARDGDFLFGQNPSKKAQHLLTDETRQARLIDQDVIGPSGIGTGGIGDTSKELNKTKLPQNSNSADNQTMIPVSILHLRFSRNPLVLEVKIPRDEIVFIGRLETGVDLTPYGGMEQGVSRQHAMFHYLGDDLVIVDMNSSNGTYVNEKKLVPQQVCILKHGDEICFGKLDCKVYFHNPVLPAPE